jgi:3-oxoacyl-[acyl-carrier protein] reductase
MPMPSNRWPRRSRDAGGDALAWAIDLADARAIERVFAEIADHFGAIDILVNNAGISRFAPIDSDDFEAAWDISLNVLLTAHTRTIRASLPWLRKAEHPRIVNIASTEGLGATKFGSPYTAAKTGVIGLTRSWRWSSAARASPSTASARGRFTPA